MNILIVDDQASVISALKSGIHWNLLGITQIFTALNALEAKHIIKSHSIDILLSDIEMPIENGLSLLRWCRQNNYELECIFLTSHADFFYAQEALQLGSYNYVLQPVRYGDLEAILREVISKITKKAEEHDYLSYGKAVFFSKSSLLKNIFNDIFQEKTNINVSEKLSLLYKIAGDSFSLNSKIHLLKLQIISWTDEAFPSSEWHGVAEKKITDFFHYYHHDAIIYSPEKNELLALLYSNTDEFVSLESYASKLQLLYSQLQTDLHCHIALYSTPSSHLEEIVLSANIINQLIADNILLKPGVYIANPHNDAISISYCDSKLLESFRFQLSNRNTKQVSTSVKAHLQSLIDKNLLNRETLLTFCKDFEQCAISASYYLGLDIHDFPTRQKGQSLDSIESLNYSSALGFIDLIIDYFNSAKDLPTSTKCHLNKISNYIHQNLDKPLKCADIAQEVYLSPDYITKLIRKEYGVTLKDFIIKEKMTAAQHLLKSTNLSISQIAVKLGYDNFSHFSQVYKKYNGLSPSQERCHITSTDHPS